jgi:hypothetical protein
VLFDWHIGNRQATMAIAATDPSRRREQELAMGKLLHIAGFALLCVATSATGSAAIYQFAMSPVSAPSTTFNFLLPSVPTPTSSIDGDSFTLKDVSICDYQLAGCDFPATIDLTFYTGASGGGLSRTGGYFGGVRYFGDTVFAGNVGQPHFLTGIFSVTDNQIGATTQLGVSVADAVPELPTWAGLLTGFAIVGAQRRRRWPGADRAPQPAVAQG